MKNGWSKRRLGELAEVIAGQSPDGSCYNADGKGMPFYQGKKEFGDKFIGEPTTWTTQVTRIAKEGDVLMSVRAPVGPVNFATREMCIGRGLAAIRCRNQLKRDFLFYFLVSKRDEIEGTEGAVFASINKSQIEQIEIAAPPLPDQQRIVCVLDEAFAAIATAKANAEKNLQNAGDLFESHLQSVFTLHGKAWVEKKLGDVCKKVTDGEHLRPRVTEIGVPFLSAKDVLDHDVDFSDCLYVADEDAQKFRKRCDPEAGDILIVSRGATVGRTCIVKTEKVFCLLGSVILLKIGDSILPQFVTHYLKCPRVRHSLMHLSEASAQQAIYLRDIKPLPIAFPNPDEQRRIVTKLDELHEETQRLARLYERKLAALGELKKSLLHQAFSGEL